MKDINLSTVFGMDESKILSLIFALLFVSASARSSVAGDSLKLDGGIRYGRLPNGFTYYIKPMEGPQKKLFMNLTVKVGFFHQNEEQLDYAHALEHMAFKGSKHFTDHILNDVQLLNRLGIQKHDIDARTSNKYTRYIFNLSPDYVEEDMDTAFLFLHDVARDLDLSEEAINEEKGPLRQELIYREGASLKDFYINNKMYSELIPCKSDWTGFFEHIRNFSPESLIEFYDKWYRPDLMAITIIGNIDNVDALEEKIIERFSDIQESSNPMEQEVCQWDYFGRPRQFVHLQKDADLSDPMVRDNIDFHLYYRDQVTTDNIYLWDGLKRGVLWKLITMTLNKRFKESMNTYNSYFRAYSKYSFKDHPSALWVKISSKNNDGQIVERIARTMAQLKKYGISDEEWAGAKLELLGILDRWNEEDPEYWKNQIEDHFVYNEALPSSKAFILKDWFSNLTLDKLNIQIMELVPEMPEDIGMIVGDKDRALNYSEEKIRGWITKGNVAPMDPYLPPKVPMGLMSKKQSRALPVRGYTNKGKGKSGAREVQLENGVKVILKSYKPSVGKKQDAILVHGFSPKGASCFPKEDYYTAINAPDIIKNSGVGDMDKFELNRFLATTSFWQGVFPYVTNYETGIKGNVHVDDLEQIFQLIYLYFAKPRTQKVAFQDWKMNQLYSSSSQGYNKIHADFNSGIREVLGDSTMAPLGTGHIKGVHLTDMEKVPEIYSQLYGNPKDFTFIITGDFSMEKALPILQKYLGNLPHLNDYSSCRSKISEIKKLPKGPLYKELKAPEAYHMESVRYSMHFIDYAKNGLDWKEKIKVEVLGGYMKRRVEGLRFDIGAALYGFGFGSRFNDELLFYSLNISLDCIPEELGWLRKECDKIIEGTKSNPLSADIFKEVKNRIVHPIYDADRLKRNDQMAKRLYKAYRYGLPWIEASRIENYARYLTLKDIQKTAIKYFKAENRVEFVMGDNKPEP